MLDAIDLKKNSFTPRKNVAPANVKPKKPAAIHQEKRADEAAAQRKAKDARANLATQGVRRIQQRGMVPIPQPRRGKLKGVKRSAVSVASNLSGQGGQTRILSNRGGMMGGESSGSSKQPKKFLDMLGVSGVVVDEALLCIVVFASAVKFLYERYFSSDSEVNSRNARVPAGTTGDETGNRISAWTWAWSRQLGCW